MPNIFTIFMSLRTTCCTHSTALGEESHAFYFTLHDEHLLLVVECGLSYVNVFSL